MNPSPRSPSERVPDLSPILFWLGGFRVSPTKISCRQKGALIRTSLLEDLDYIDRGPGGSSSQKGDTPDFHEATLLLGPGGPSNSGWIFTKEGTPTQEKQQPAVYSSAVVIILWAV